MKNKIRNFTAATPNVSKDVLKIGLEQPKYFRTEEFAHTLQECSNILKELLNVPNGYTAFITSSGTGAMESVVSNFINIDDNVLIINRGLFGQRWSDICNEYNVNFLETDSFDIEKFINSHNITIILMQSNETSTMEKLPLFKIGRICKKYNIKLIVDAISSFVIDSIDMNKNNIYACLMSSQKGLDLPSGLSIVVTKGRPELYPRGYYFNLENYFYSLDEDLCLPFTPNVILINQLYYRLKEIKKIGLDNIIKKRKELANHFRKLIRKLPLEIVTKNMSNCGTLLRAKSKVGKIKKFFRYLQTKNIFITPTGGEEGDTFIVSHIGDLNKEDNLVLYEELRQWLKE
jgi:aspartate aminotransferase-like enzyme